MSIAFFGVLLMIGHKKKNSCLENGLSSSSALPLSSYKSPRELIDCEHGPIFKEGDDARKIRHVVDTNFPRKVDHRGKIMVVSFVIKLLDVTNPGPRKIISRLGLVSSGVSIDILVGETESLREILFIHPFFVFPG